jgi:type IV secretory pathway TrbD component
MHKSLRTMMGVVGFALAAFCGSTLNRVVGLGIEYAWVIPGFALGIIIVSISMANRLNSRVERLERQVLHLQEK